MLEIEDAIKEVSIGGTPLLLRDGREGDVAFILSSWLKSFRVGSWWGMSMKGDTYFAYHHQVLEHTIPRAVVLVLCNPEFPSQILGYVCYERTASALILHYTYVKERYRHQGVATAIIEAVMEVEFPELGCWEVPVYFTHGTKAGANIRRDHDGHETRFWEHNPYILFQSLPVEWHKEDP